MKLSTLPLLSLLGLATAQSLSDALKGYPDASQFSTHLGDISGDLNTTNGQEYTVLVPTNEAFRDFATRTGQNFSSLSQDQRRTYLEYHVLVGSLTSANFSSPQGITVPTLLKNVQYNNRTAGPGLIQKYGAAANGQVLFIDAFRSGSSKFRVRRQADAVGLQIRGGLAENASLTAIDGTWNGGKFQTINQ
jgi:hypothetical protein